MSSAAAVRPARFAGTWYPGEPDALRRMLAGATPAAAAGPALAVVAPHAGYRFSLPIAAETYARVEVPATAVVLCPNHTVPPPVVSIWPSGAWETPLGRVAVDEELAAAIRAECPAVTDAPVAHQREHAVELHLPLLQHHRPDVKVVPLVVAAPRVDELRALGEGIARAIGAREDVLLVASTDMTHQQPADVARAQDERALARLLALDPAGLLETCEREGITMCGVRPTTAALYAALAMGATRAELVRYGHSGEASGDYDRVVGYAGAVVRK